MSDGSVRADRAGGVLSLTLDRPNKLNAFSPDLIAGLTARLREAAADPGVRVVSLAGAGRAFCAGADLGVMAGPDREAALEYVRAGAAMVDLLAGLGKPVVAAIHGPAFGGGLEVALACTIRVASDLATVGLPEVVLGVMPGWGGTQRFARLAGQSRAALAALTGDPLDAATALAWGVVDRVVPHDQLAETVAALCARIAGHRAEAVTAIHAAVGAAAADPAAGLAAEAELFRRLFLLPETPGLIDAFLQARRGAAKPG